MYEKIGQKVMSTVCSVFQRQMNNDVFSVLYPKIEHKMLNKVIDLRLTF